jgi:hypothetical protein
MPRVDGVQQLRGFLIPFGFSQGRGVGSGQRFHARDRQPQEQPIGGLGAKFRIGKPQPTGLPAERADRRPGTGQHLDTLVSGQQSGQPGIAHLRIDSGGGGEHLQRDLRVVAGL